MKSKVQGGERRRGTEHAQSGERQPRNGNRCSSSSNGGPGPVLSAWQKLPFNPCNTPEALLGGSAEMATTAQSGYTLCPMPSAGKWQESVEPTPRAQRGRSFLWSPPQYSLAPQCSPGACSDCARLSRQRGMRRTHAHSCLHCSPATPLRAGPILERSANQ